MATRAVQADGLGGLDVLTLREVSAPTSGAGQVLVRTVASTINPVDCKMRANQNLTFPLTLGWDVAGVVVESDVLDYRPGDRVIAMTDPMSSGVGAWTDLVGLDAEQLAHAPTSVAMSDAVTIPLAGLTALQTWNKLVLSPGDRVLVTGAAGGIGGFAIQLGANAGIEVDGLVSRSSHVNPVRSLGAGFVTSDPSALPARAYTAVVDTIALPSKGFDVRELITDDGQYAATGKDDSKIPGGHSIRVTYDPEGLGHLVKIVDDGALSLRVAAHYGLHEIRAAHEHFEAGGLLGKVVLHL
jgi:NADPH:quinone reductase-like Zn-dependent oxidoreductase